MSWDVLKSVCGGETGIRTLDTLRYTRFPSVRLQPLGHLSAIERAFLNLTQLTLYGCFSVALYGACASISSFTLASGRSSNGTPCSI